MDDIKFIERNIEKPVCEYAQGQGWLCRKLQWVGRRGGPDRFFARDGRIVLIEFKRPGRAGSLQQAREHRRLRKHGVEVYLVDSVERGREILE